jgi:DNA polymerase III subunit delta
MIILLYGQDSYRSRQKLRDIIDRYKKIHKSGLSLAYFDGENLKFEDFKDAIQQVSMFEEKKLLILSNVFANADFKEKFLKNIKEFSEAKDTILFYEDDKIPGKDKFFNFLKKKAKTQDFSVLEKEKLRSWVEQEFLRFKAEASPEAVAKLIEFVGSDLWLLSNEIKKLVNYKKGGKISTDDVTLLAGPRIETAIFKTIDAISQKNKKQALLLIHQHLVKGDSPLYLLSMINFQFKNLLMVKDLMEKHEPYYLISKKAQLHPFVVRKSYQQAGRFTFPELKKIYQKIFQADLEIKTGKVSPETALDLLIAGI